MKKIISIVIPVYNEEKNILIAYNEIKSVLIECKNYDHEIIFTDNCSQDKTYSLLEQISAGDKCVKVIRFSKNIGYQKSILHGTINTSGDAVIHIDGDIQDPPILIKDFISHWEKGYQVVYGVRITRKENFFMNSLRSLFYKFINLISDEPIPIDAGDFRLLDKSIVNYLRKIDNNNPYLRGIIAHAGFKQIGLEYNREKRLFGKSKFNLTHLISLALDGILSHSILPLRIASIFGILMSCFTAIGSIGYIFFKIFFYPDWPRGFATTTILILFSLSMNALFLGIIGEYVGRIYRENLKRPVSYQNKINF